MTSTWCSSRPTLLETVTVTPTRTEQRLGDVPASVSVVSSEDIRRRRRVVADDVLRQVPTFSLFRRTSSLSSHPTTQGVSLRGIGPSGVSRTLVLLDGMPFNDPFGGWVYWTRVPLENVDRIEVVDGSSSSLYGNYAMGGVINIVTSTGRAPDGSRCKHAVRQPRQSEGRLLRQRRVGQARRARRRQRLQDRRISRSCAPNERGPIDNNADVEYRNVNVEARLQPDRRALNAFVRAGYFDEDRNNGKVGEVNDTRWTVGQRRRAAPAAATAAICRAASSATFRDVHSNFLAVTTRATTRAASFGSPVDQHVPTNAVGAMVQWTKSLSGSQRVQRGRRLALGRRREPGGRVQRGSRPRSSFRRCTIASVLTLQRVSGGTQQLSGAFVQDIFTPLLEAHDHAQRARSITGATTTATTSRTTVIPASRRPTTGRSSPERERHGRQPARRGAMYHVTDRVSVWGAIGSGFRAPTLNELYRQFRVGTVLTLAEQSTRARASARRRSGRQASRRRAMSRPGRPGSTTASRIRCRT